MKTTLKKGIGRTASQNGHGNGRAILPPTALAPVTRYRQPVPERRVRLGELEPGVGGAEQLEELALLGVVGARGIPERGPDAAVALGDQLLARRLG